MTPFDLLGWACALAAVIAVLYGTAFGAVFFWHWWRIWNELAKLPPERPTLKPLHHRLAASAN